MASIGKSVAQALSPDSSEIIHAESALPSLPIPLQRIDDIVSIVAVLGAICLLITWLRKGRKNPLENSPSRPHRFTAETVGLAIIGYCLSGIILALALGEWNTENRASIRSQFIGIGTHFAATIFCLWLIARQFDGGIRRFIIAPELNVRRTTATIGMNLLLALGCCPLILLGTVWLVQLFAPNQAFPVHATLTALQNQDQPLSVVISLWLAAAAIAPLAEEIFFRGILQSVVSNLSNNRWLGILFAAIAFAFAHSSQPHVIPAIAFLGILCGLSYEKTGSLLVPITIHALFNLKTLIWQALAT